MTSTQPLTGLEPAYSTPKSPPQLRLLASAAIHVDVGDPDAAGNDLDTWVQLYADNAEAIRLRGQLQRVRGDEA